MSEAGTNSEMSIRKKIETEMKQRKKTWGVNEMKFSINHK